MSASLAFAIYFICWWVVLFAVLPLKIGPQAPEGQPDPFADASGAPHAPNIGRKFLLTTLISAVIFAVVYAVFELGWISVDRFPF
jgi:predicted secreted protein